MKRTTKLGFALIDLLVSIMISSIMSTVLFTMIFQIQKSENAIDEVVRTGMQAALLHERLQKDFTGLFWPKFMPEKTQNKQITGDTQKEQKESAGPQIAKILYSQNTRDGDVEILKECSFITSNPLQIYNESKPRIARVIYTLQAEPEQAGSFELQRQEGPELDYQVVKKEAPLFVLISGIKTLKITYFYQDQSKLKDELDHDQVNLIEKDELDYDATGDGQVPRYVKINLALWHDTSHQDFKEFEFWFDIYAPANKNQEKPQAKTPEKIKNETN